MDPVSISVIGAAALIVASLGVYIVKDIYSKTGDIPALQERIKFLEEEVKENRPTKETLIRVEEKVNHLTTLVESLAKRFDARV